MNGNTQCDKVSAVMATLDVIDFGQTCQRRPQEARLERSLAAAHIYKNGLVEDRVRLGCITKNEAPKDFPDVEFVVSNGRGRERAFLIMAIKHRALILVTVQFFLLAGRRIGVRLCRASSSWSFATAFDENMPL